MRMIVLTNFFYIYNRHQANFFIQSGLRVVEVGKGSKGESYAKFIRDEEAEKVFAEWIKKKNKLEQERK